MSKHTEIPELTEEQVDRMYRRVTGRIDLDASDARTRRRKVLLAAASVVVVLGIGGAVVGSGLTVLSGSSSDSSFDKLSVPEEQAREDVGGARDFSEGVGKMEGSAHDEAREIVVTAFASLTVDDPAAAADTLSRWVEGEDGRVESRSESTHDGDASISLRLRMPADTTGDTTRRLRELGEVSDLSIDSEDVTAQGRDLDARIRALEVSTARLQDLMAEAATTADLLAAEETLARRQADLEALQAERRGLSDQVARATYTVEISSEERPDAPSRSGFVGALEAGWDGLVATLGFVVRVVGFLIPWAALLALLAGAYLGARRLLWR